METDAVNNASSISEPEAVGDDEWPGEAAGDDEWPDEAAGAAPDRQALLRAAFSTTKSDTRFSKLKSS